MGLLNSPRWFLAAAVMLTTLPQTFAQQKIIKGKADFKPQIVTMEKGYAYRVKVKTKGFRPYLEVRGKTGGTSRSSFQTTEVDLVYAPRTTEDVKVLILSRGFLKDKASLDYELLIEKAVFKPFQEIDKKLTVRNYKYDFEAGKPYLIQVEGEGFSPSLVIKKGDEILAQSVMDYRNTLVASLLFRPQKAGNYDIWVSMHSGLVKAGDLSYYFSVAPANFLVNVDAKLTSDDPLYPRNMAYHKAYKLKMSAGETYTIRLNSGRFDTYVVLEDDTGKAVGRDDDGGDKSNSMLLFTCRKSGTYRVVATSFGKGKGDFSLTVLGSSRGKALLNQEAKLSRNDPIYKKDNRNSPYKAHLVKFEAGKLYGIALTSKSFDTHLYLEDASGKVLGNNDDDASSRNSALKFACPKSGTYHIIATTHNSGIGPYALRVVDLGQVVSE